jgi:hypothetical protein
VPVAIATGQEMIDVDVTEVLTQPPLPAFPATATQCGPEPGGLRCHGLRPALPPVASFMGEASGTLRCICTMSNFG